MPLRSVWSDLMKIPLHQGNPSQTAGRSWQSPPQHASGTKQDFYGSADKIRWKEINSPWMSQWELRVSTSRGIKFPSFTTNHIIFQELLCEIVIPQARSPVTLAWGRLWVRSPGLGSWVLVTHWQGEKPLPATMSQLMEGRAPEFQQEHGLGPSLLPFRTKMHK